MEKGEPGVKKYSGFGGLRVPIEEARACMNRAREIKTDRRRRHQAAVMAGDFELAAQIKAETKPRTERDKVRVRLAREAKKLSPPAVVVEQKKLEGQLTQAARCGGMILEPLRQLTDQELEAGYRRVQFDDKRLAQMSLSASIKLLDARVDPGGGVQYRHEYAYLSIKELAKKVHSTDVVRQLEAGFEWKLTGLEALDCYILFRELCYDPAMAMAVYAEEKKSVEISG